MSESLYYVVREPKIESKNPPLLILLHGYGSNEQDLFSFADELPDEMLIVSARAPFDMSFNGYAWYSIDFDADMNKFSNIPEAKESVKKIANFIDQIQNKYKTNPDKTFLLGFSQGAILSYSISFIYPNKVNYVVALSGYLNPDLLPDSISTDIKTQYYISHGSVDQVIPVEWARQASPYIKKIGLQTQYQEYRVGHGVAPQNFFSFKEWIEKRL